MTTTQKTKPIAVLISDIHFNINNLELAEKSLLSAIEKAYEIEVPLYICGDLHDTKANLRGECVNSLIKLFREAFYLGVYTTTIVGNHDLINEKSEENSINFLSSLTDIVKHPIKKNGLYFIPYQHDSAKFKEILTDIPQASTILCHQGITGAESGEYIYDKSAVPKEWLTKYRIISGHYHKRQDIICAPKSKLWNNVGLASYIGSPYTMSFAEANDGPKGFQILNDDGTLEFVPTNLRKHVIIEVSGKEYKGIPADQVKSTDLLWLKIHGSSSDLRAIKKDEIGNHVLGHSNYKLDLIPTDVPKLRVQDADKKSSAELFDNLIDASSETEDQKKYLKILWRKVYEDHESSR